MALDLFHAREINLGTPRSIVDEIATDTRLLALHLGLIRRERLNIVSVQEGPNHPSVGPVENLHCCLACEFNLSTRLIGTLHFVLERELDLFVSFVIRSHLAM